MNITIFNDSLTATINPKGAELVSIKDLAKREYIWQGDPKYWGKHSPVLFPIVGTLRDDTYHYNGKTYTMTRHGFARDSVFTVKTQTDNSVVFSLTADEDTKKVYPFDFELQLTYRLEGEILSLDYTVTNRGYLAMPFSLGAHPAFALSEDFESYSLAFEKEETMVSTVLSNDLLSDKMIILPVQNRELKLDYDLFANDALILTSHASRRVDILKGGQPFLRVSFADFPHLGIWTKPGAPFLCIEPWHGYADRENAAGDITEKEGIIIIDGNNTFTAGFDITILR